MSTEQYDDPPLFDLRFPNELDLINYTMRGDISEITIPPSLVQERLRERITNGMLLTNNANHNTTGLLDFVILCHRKSSSFLHSPSQSSNG